LIGSLKSGAKSTDEAEEDAACSSQGDMAQLAALQKFRHRKSLASFLTVFQGAPLF